MVTGIHFILTYSCNFECDHCFVYSSPHAKGTFTLEQLKKVFPEINKIDTVKRVYFEGGEPFLFYPLMVEGIRIARENGLEVGIVTNAYWATNEEDAELWLRPLMELGIANLSISNDPLHAEDEMKSPAIFAVTAAKKLGMPVMMLYTEKPDTEMNKDLEKVAGAKIFKGDTMFRGRAVEKLIEGLLTKPWGTFTECPHEDLKNPKRVHIDAYGNVSVCQGISMGNMWQTPLSKLIKNYDCGSHPICGPLAKGGPALLAEECRLKHEDGYIDACHFCYLTRLKLMDKFPQLLVPRQVYGF